MLGWGRRTVVRRPFLYAVVGRVWCEVEAVGQGGEGI